VFRQFADEVVVVQQFEHLGRVVVHVLGAVLACEFHERAYAAWVVWYIVRNIIHVAINNHP